MRVELNKVYCMDNLELLKQMDDNSVDLIYCDILYNTGKKFKDYNDNLGTPQQAMEWYKPRLIEMKRVLKDTGSIYLQCDYRLVHYLKVEMDAIFGISNFRNDIIWQYSWGVRTEKCWNKKHDNIIMYSKSNQITFNVNDVLEKRNLQEQSKNRLKYKGALISDGNKRKNGLVLPTDVWNIPIINGMSKERVGYNTQKPKILLEKIIKASSNKGDTIADFFVGSGTSLVVAKELGRNYIGCDINQRAVDITNKRLEEVGK